MSTSRSTWKRRERDAAGLFGARRQMGSGAIGPSRSDSDHPTLYLETKLRASSAVRSLWEATAAKARREGKTPALVLYSKGKTGGLIVVHEMHLAAVAVELRTAPGREIEPSPLIAEVEPFHPGDGA